MQKHDSMRISGNFIIEEAVRLVEEGRDVTFPVKGDSMLPFIVGGREKVVFSPVKTLRKGLIVLAFTTDGRYVVHRISDIKDDKITLMGDGNLGGKEFCLKQNVKAQVNYVVGENGKKRFQYNLWRRFAAKMWAVLLPLRKYLIRIIRKVKKI